MTTKADMDRIPDLDNQPNYDSIGPVKMPPAPDLSPEEIAALDSQERVADAEDRAINHAQALEVAAQKREELGIGADGGGKRMNKGKLRMELLPPEWEVALADVMTKGSLKYDARNWEQGMPWSVMIGCMKRHLVKFQAGERYDGEGFDLEEGTTGCHHLAMVAWNALALMAYDLRNIGENDLPAEQQYDLFAEVNAESAAAHGLRIED